MYNYQKKKITRTIKAQVKQARIYSNKIMDNKDNNKQRNVNYITVNV